MYNQDNIPIQEASSPTAINSGKSSVADAQVKDFKITILTMFKDLKRI